MYANQVILMEFTTSRLHVCNTTLSGEPVMFGVSKHLDSLAVPIAFYLIFFVPDLQMMMRRTIKVTPWDVDTHFTGVSLLEESILMCIWVCAI